MDIFIFRSWNVIFWKRHPFRVKVFRKVEDIFVISFDFYINLRVETDRKNIFFYEEVQPVCYRKRTRSAAFSLRSRKKTTGFPKNSNQSESPSLRGNWGEKKAVFSPFSCKSGLFHSMWKRNNSKCRREGNRSDWITGSRVSMLSLSFETVKWAKTAI